MDTPVFFEIANHESPDTTVYIAVQFAGTTASPFACTGDAVGVAAGNAGTTNTIDDSAMIHRFELCFDRRRKRRRRV
jgi:hypothetical protein